MIVLRGIYEGFMEAAAGPVEHSCCTKDLSLNGILSRIPGFFCKPQRSLRPARMVTDIAYAYD